MPPSLPLLSFPTTPTPKPYENDEETPRRRWYHNLPIGVTVALLLAPHPSLLYVLVDFHLLTLQSPAQFALHLIVTYALTFLAFCSLIVCVARDPGPVVIPAKDGDGETTGLTEALGYPEDDFNAPGKWCRKCWAPKPERTHHCSFCGRCVLKMDHHCPWLGQKCIGHRTYPAFVHFLSCVTLLAFYIFVICILALKHAFNDPFGVNPKTPVHEIFLAFAGIIFTLIIGSFLIYHLFLITTNQTTLEHISPFLLLKQLPPLPQTGHDLSDPPLEPELSYEQRHLVRDAHGAVKLYDLGWKRNWAQVWATKRRFGWIHRLIFGGASFGDGKSFPRNPRSEDMLARLAVELVKADKNR